MFSSLKKKKKSSAISPKTSILEQEQQEDQQQQQRSRPIEFYTSPRYIQRSKDIFIVSKIRWGEGKKEDEKKSTVTINCASRVPRSRLEREGQRRKGSTEDHRTMEHRGIIAEFAVREQ